MFFKLLTSGFKVVPEKLSGAAEISAEGKRRDQRLAGADRRRLYSGTADLDGDGGGSARCRSS